ncbi:MAG: hypothetical protein EB059_04215 [Alphaproteobacteria bacterium]|nr:hypothetical protein [Alphaproteobacteria bacterium]
MTIMNTPVKNMIVKSAVMAGVLAMAWPTMAQAQNLQATSAALVAALKDMPVIISGMSYMFGGLLVLGGANKLKMHAENPQQTPMSHGLVRLGVGGIIAGLPPFMGWVNNSLSIGGGSMKFKKMDSISSLITFNGLC